jgi:Xaa-Pro aminopeptidase
MTNIKARVERLRALMRGNNIDAYLIPSSDPHQNEYVPRFWQRRRYITGFTGSAGEAVITRDKAGLWTDSRYFIQAEEELDREVFTLFKAGLPETPTIRQWLASELRAGEKLGFDPRLITGKNFEEMDAHFKKRGIVLKGIPENLVDLIWEERPAPPKEPIFVHEDRYTGATVKEKLGRLREKMAEEEAASHIVTKLDSLAWLFNIRGGDIRFNPVAIAYGVVTEDEAFLFIDTDKVPETVRQRLGTDVVIKEYGAFEGKAREIAGRGAVWLDESGSSRWVLELMGGAELILKASPIEMFKAVKNPVEIEGMRRAHIRDGAALVKFLCWLDGALGRERVTEISAAEKAEEYRAGMDSFMGLSFETISSFGAHGAVVHYSVAPETDVPVEGRGLYLIDSGGQYLDGTTDITRTVPVGEPTKEERDRFTRVLKGLISLTTTPFPKGTVGKQLDILARRPLWKRGLNFLHGTGHGLGHFLNVHEGPQAISYYRCIGVALEPGMISTIEPGYYKEGHYGMRVENAVLVVEDEEHSAEGQEYYRFDTLTLCPIDRRLILPELLDSDEMEWLNDYHARVRTILSPLLEPGEAAWLKSATLPL